MPASLLLVPPVEVPPPATVISDAAVGLPPGRVVEAHSLAALDRIRDPDIALCLIERPLSAAFDRWLDGLPAEALPTVRLTVAPVRVMQALAPVFDRSGLPPGAFRRQLLADIALLVRRFADVAGVAEVDLRLEAIDTDACWKWHVDWVPLRLVATYRGPGTLIADPRRPDRATPLRRHQVALFKGETWRPATVAPVVHRSPPVAGSGVTRLFLCLNLPEGEGGG
ncbi:DUF1826 domain-containing protein [Caenispirillum bisanense]|uniref:DUF1826 domain-containing protein n=1 Tax=Caenispirillum bisanense TaxID=414052 RepID=UPI0031E48255